MGLSSSFVVWLLWTVASLTVVECTNSTVHEQILNILQSSGYDSGARPNFHGDPVVLEVDMVLISVGPVNEMDMTWTASFYLRQEWTDERLAVHAGTGGSKVNLAGKDVDKLWLPDLFFSNNKKGKKHSLTVMNHVINLNTSTGRMIYSQRLTVVLSCEMDLTKFPHDNQTCHLKIESYGYTAKDLILKWSSSRDATLLLPTANMPDFDIQDIKTHDCTATYALGTYPCLVATMKINREIGFYIFQTYLPSILIVILSWASFWIDHEAVPARISVGLLTVLTITTQLSGSRAQLPRVPYIKAIDVWMSVNLVFVFAAYMEYAVVTVLSRKYKKGQRGNSLSYARQESQVSLPRQRKGDNSSTTIDIADSPDPPSSPSSSPCPPSSICPMLGSQDTGHKVDKTSRSLFPAVYAVFNVIYWAYYLTIVV